MCLSRISGAFDLPPRKGSGLKSVRDPPRVSFSFVSTVFVLVVVIQSQTRWLSERDSVRVRGEEGVCQRAEDDGREESVQEIPFHVRDLHHHLGAK